MIHFKKEEENLNFTKSFFLKDFFKLEKDFDFNQLTFYLDMNETEVQFLDSKIVMRKLNRISEIQQLQDRITNYFEINASKIDTDLYGSLNKYGVSPTHSDEESVLIFCTYGRVVYNLYEEDTYSSFLLEKGDIIYIPKFIAHAAIPLGPRICMSVGIHD